MGIGQAFALALMPAIFAAPGSARAPDMLRFGSCSRLMIGQRRLHFVTAHLFAPG